MDRIGQDVRSFFCGPSVAGRDLALGGNTSSLGLSTCLKVLLNYLKKVLPVNI